MTSHTVSVNINTPIEITWNRHHVTGHRCSHGSLSNPTAPSVSTMERASTAAMTSSSDKQRRFSDIQHEVNAVRQSTTSGAARSWSDVDLATSSVSCANQFRNVVMTTATRSQYHQSEGGSSNSFDVIVDRSQVCSQPCTMASLRVPEGVAILFSRNRV